MESLLWASPITMVMISISTDSLILAISREGVGRMRMVFLREEVPDMTNRAI